MNVWDLFKDVKLPCLTFFWKFGAVALHGSLFNISCHFIYLKLQQIFNATCQSQVDGSKQQKVTALLSVCLQLKSRTTEGRHH